MMVLDHTGKGTLVETLPAAPTSWSEAATKECCHIPDDWDVDEAVTEQLMNAGALA